MRMKRQIICGFFCLVFCSLGVFVSAEEPAQGLRDGMQILGRSIGTCAGAALVQRDAAYADLLAQEFNMLTPENDMKIARLQPEEGRFTFDSADQLVAFAETHGMKVRGHTLVWHLFLPKWLSDKEWEKDELNQVMRTHILTVAGRYKGKIDAWDVLNEAVEHDGRLRESLWYKTLGPDYIDNAFRWAREADPHALLFYNDFDAEGMNAKADGVYALVKGMKERGVPLDGVGFQLHVDAENPPSIEAMRKNMQRLVALGLQIHFTEIDVRVSLPMTPERLEKQAACYAALLELCLSEPACTAFVTWGFTDRYSWVPRFFEGYGDALLFDRDKKPKPAYEAVRSILFPTQPHDGNFKD